jgi:predicted metallo-beta-lactamase superfamily hydrolase
VQSIWLAVSPQLVEARIHQESRRDSRSSSERLLIDQFVRRSKLYDEHMRRALARLELTSIEVDTVASINALTDTCLRHVRLGCEEA